MDYIRKLGISPNFDSESLRCTNTEGKFYILLTARKVFLNVRTVTTKLLHKPLCIFSCHYACRASHSASFPATTHDEQATLHLFLPLRMSSGHSASSPKKFSLHLIVGRRSVLTLSALPFFLVPLSMQSMFVKILRLVHHL